MASRRQVQVLGIREKTRGDRQTDAAVGVNTGAPRTKGADYFEEEAW